MELKPGKLGLLIPNASKVFTMTLDQIKAWHAALPVADLGETAKEIFNLVKTINAATIEPKDRFAILNIFYSQVSQICNSLRKNYWKHTSILSTQIVTIFEFLYVLQIEVINAYKLVLEALYVQNIHTKEKDYFVGALCHIIECYIAITLRCYQTYQLVPTGVWLEIYKLYEIIEQYDLFQHKIVDIQYGEIGMTAMDSYKHIILLAAIKPYAWQQVDQEVLNAALGVWQKNVTIKKYMHEDQTVGFVFNTTVDTPPVAKNAKLIQPGEHTYMLELGQTIEYLQQLIATKVASNYALKQGDVLQNAENKIGVYTLKNLVASWEHSQSMRATRFSIGGKFNITIGWVNVHYFIANKKTFNADEIATIVLSKKEKHKNTEVVVGRVDSLSIDEVNSCQLYVCNVININAYGCCLLWNNGFDVGLQPGDLVAINPSDDMKSINWSIGVLCWLSRDKNNELRVGVKTLAPRAIAAAAQIVQKDKTSQYLRCFLVPERPADKVKASLITAIFPFQTGKIINLYNIETDECMEIILGEEIASSGRFKQFLFDTHVDTKSSIQENTEIKDPVDPEVDKDQDKFNNIFSRL